MLHIFSTYICLWSSTVDIFENARGTLMHIYSTSQELCTRKNYAYLMEYTVMLDWICSGYISQLVWQFPVQAVMKGLSKLHFRYSVDDRGSIFLRLFNSMGDFVLLYLQYFVNRWLHIFLPLPWQLSKILVLSKTNVYRSCMTMEQPLYKLIPVLYEWWCSCLHMILSSLLSANLCASCYETLISEFIMSWSVMFCCMK